MKIDAQKTQELNQKHGAQAPSVLPETMDESVVAMASHFSRCIVDEDDGCTYCQRPNGEWELVFCPD